MSSYGDYTSMYIGNLVCYYINIVFFFRYTSRKSTVGRGLLNFSRRSCYHRFVSLYLYILEMLNAMNLQYFLMFFSMTGLTAYSITYLF